MNTRISQVFRDADGKVQRIVCGKPPEDVAEFERVEIADQIFFRKVGSCIGRANLPAVLSTSAPSDTIRTQATLQKW